MFFYMGSGEEFPSRFGQRPRFLAPPFKGAGGSLVLLGRTKPDFGYQSRSLPHSRDFDTMEMVFTTSYQGLPL
ncbi:hypothetical protein ABE42_04900 [Bacillus thuringiensis]|nr:hypothetical protein [Bacillus thuringiensis]